MSCPIFCHHSFDQLLMYAVYFWKTYNLLSVTVLCEGLCNAVVEQWRGWFNMRYWLLKNICVDDVCIKYHNMICKNTSCFVKHWLSTLHQEYLGQVCFISVPTDHFQPFTCYIFHKKTINIYLHVHVNGYKTLLDNFQYILISIVTYIELGGMCIEVDMLDLRLVSHRF